MRLPRPQRKERGEEVVPLVNIVFLLLIFLMLSGQIGEPEPFDVNPPGSESLEPVASHETAVIIAADGRLAVGRQEVQLATLVGVVKHALERSAKHVVSVKADQRVDAGHVIEVLEKLRAAGAEKLILVTAEVPD